MSSTRAVRYRKLALAAKVKADADLLLMLADECDRCEERRAEGEGEMSELDPTPELPDSIPIREVWFPTQIKDALFAAGLKTVGQVRTISDEALLALPVFGAASVTHLRHTLGSVVDRRS